MIDGTFFVEQVKEASRILITTHIYPDADGIGSQIALGLALRSLGKEVICVNEEELFDRYKYLDTQNLIIGAEKLKKQEQKFDLAIVVDTNSVERVGPKVAAIIGQAKSALYVDHHPCKLKGPKYVIDTKASSTGELSAILINQLGVKYTKEMALSIYTAILIDTSSFRYPTVNENTHNVLAKLLATGIKPPEAYNKIYGTKKISHMQLLGKVLSRARNTSKGRVAWIKIYESELEEFNSDHEDTHAFINHLLVLENIKVAIMFREFQGKIKVSFRSNGSVDVGLLAQTLGGGGHNHSAATIVELTMEEAVEQIVAGVKEFLS